MDDIEKLFFEGLNLLEAGNAAGAAENFRRVIRERPLFAPGYTELGIALHVCDKLLESLEVLKVSIDLDPGAARAHLAMGSTLHRLDRIEESLPHTFLALKADPNSADAHTSLALAMFYLRRLDEARQPLQRALALNPEKPDARYLRGVFALLLGDFKNGWPDYEFRWIMSGTGSSKPPSPGPEWSGKCTPGLRLLVYPEQGHGDTTQFARYLPLLTQMGIKPHFVCPSELFPVLRTLRAPIAFVPFGQPVRFDTHCPLLSLPKILGTTLETIPAQIPYLYADAAAAAQWKQRLDAFGTGRPKIGIVWAGNPHHRNDAQRSCNLAHFERLKSIDAEFFSLQKGSAAKDPRPAGFIAHDLSHHINDFGDTAAIMANLDLVIAVDTSVAHLAGALGRPCWVLLPYAGEWRWLLNRADSPWYPTLRLFRQPRRGDWGAVFEDVAAALTAKGW
jgi:tetratricopeptide (TPR) repeat protein